MVGGLLPEVQYYWSVEAEREQGFGCNPVTCFAYEYNRLKKTDPAAARKIERELSINEDDNLDLTSPEGRMQAMNAGNPFGIDE